MKADEKDGGWIAAELRHGGQGSVVWVAALVLLVGIGAVAFAGGRVRERTHRGSIIGVLPSAAELAGWSVEFIPVADTPETQAKVAELLNYDEAVFAIFRKGTHRLSVYAAYWSPGKMPHRLVASHTPDVCWVVAGWKVLATHSNVVLVGSTGGPLMPGEQRTMMFAGRVEHVVFWHLLDGRSQSYGTNWRPPWYAFFNDLLARGLNQKPEQFFIRISSAEPIERLPACFGALSRLLAAPQVYPPTN
jgi:hypothetical protein